MKILLLHPDDSPLVGCWADHNWDLIVDLGFASRFLYAEWARQLGTRVLSLREFTGNEESYRWIGRALAPGRARLLDRIGLDWWELAAVWRYQDLEALYLLQQLKREINETSINLFATRPHRFAPLAAQVMSRPVQYFSSTAWAPLERMTKRAGSLRQFSTSQLAEIAFDKWDPHYEFRRRFSKRQAPSREEVVLLPSAYSNVTRTALAYAASVPSCRFLLATTRPSAARVSLPENVRAVSLVAYSVRDRRTEQEVVQLTDAWRQLQTKALAESADLRIARDAGVFDYFPEHLRNGLFVRDAWLSLIRHEPVVGVLCGDDLNYYTRLPLALASHFGLNALYCSHGALDGGLLFKQSFADVHVVKGEMEKDYALRSGTVARIVVAAPTEGQQSAAASRDKIVFFSQPFELDGGRVEEIYRELIPRLLSLARRSGKKLVVKLHPFESLRSRRRLLSAILPLKSDLDSIQVVAHSPSPMLIADAWCGIGLDSSVAAECALKGIPFFLCQWLDFGGAGYIRQFARFGAGTLLQSPETIAQIPELVAAYRPDQQLIARLWQIADPGQLEAIMTATAPAVATCAS